jgi:hypothetical protein
MEEAFLTAVELHSIDGIRAVLEAGLDPASSIRGKLPVEWLTQMYTRSPRFSDCLRMLLEAGATLDDPSLAAVLLDDAESLAAAIGGDRSLLELRTTVTSAFTPLEGAPLLHVAAEYGNARAARVLIEAGCDVEARASIDEYGLGGHTALFHTVNSNDNYAQPILRLLLKAGARTDVRLQGIIWGKGFAWETTLFDVTPVSYAQAGLLPQMHREPADIYDNIELMLRTSHRPVPPRVNVPNEYLTDDSDSRVGGHTSGGADG